ncbi:MAG TPA: hypothetical protein VGD73_20150 [Pseudonocardia sp.]
MPASASAPVLASARRCTRCPMPTRASPRAAPASSRNGTPNQPRLAASARNITTPTSVIAPPAQGSSCPPEGRSRFSAASGRASGGEGTGGEGRGGWDSEGAGGGWGAAVGVATERESSSYRAHASLRPSSASSAARRATRSASDALVDMPFSVASAHTDRHR